MTTQDLTGRVALVTGATRGIGAAIAAGLAERGALVIAHERNSSARGGTYRTVAADFATVDGADSVVAQLADVDRIDVLVNNAGYEVEEDSTRLSRDEWQRTLDVNVWAPVRLTGLLVDKLTASSSASVINVTSIHERHAYPRHLAYSVSKAGLAMATRVLALELAPRGIRVNAVAPGAIETEINRATIDRVGRAQFERAIPAGRIGHTDDVVGAVSFLAGEAASYITGTTLFVDGAYSENIVRY